MSHVSHLPQHRSWTTQLPSLWPHFLCRACKQWTLTTPDRSAVHFVEASSHRRCRGNHQRWKITNYCFYNFLVFITTVLGIPPIVVCFPGMVFKISVRFCFVITVAPVITGAILTVLSFQDVLIAFSMSWYLVIFLIYALFTQNCWVLISQSMMSFPFCSWERCPVTRLCFVCSCSMRPSSRTWAWHPHFQRLPLVRVSMSFWNWDVEIFADMPRNHFAYFIVPLCVKLFWS